MAKPKGDGENPVSLFPFLSILACVIGTLILLIASVSITQMQSDPEEELVQRVEEYKELEEQTSELTKEQKELEELASKLGSLDEFRKQLEKLKQEIVKLREQREQHRDKHKELQDKLKELNRQKLELEQEIARVKARRAEQEKEIARLKKEIEERKLVTSAPTVRVTPGESGPGAKGVSAPVFVEVDAKGLVLDPGGKRIRVPAAAIRKDPNFHKLLASMSGNYDKTLVMLIREKGYRVYPTAEHVARINNVIVSKLPIIGDGQLDLSMF